MRAMPLEMAKFGWVLGKRLRCRVAAGVEVDDAASAPSCPLIALLYGALCLLFLVVCLFICLYLTFNMKIYIGL